ncbi:hypothetical protein J7K27_02480 [Candidatus Bathyarchaeota archaeon]|nr:hypothetical protein [Candidatus Bathyarchaeota archaeon]
MSIVHLDEVPQLIEDILNKLDITLSTLRDDLRGVDNRTLTDIYNKLGDKLPRILYDSAGNELSSYIKNLDTTLSSRASESTLGGIKTQTDKLTFDASSYLYVNAAVVANPPNLDVALSTRASENTLTNFSGKFPSAAALADNLGNPTTTIVGSALLGWDGSYWRRLAADSSSRLRTVVESLPSLPSGTNTIGAVFADYLTADSINGSVSTTEVVGNTVDCRKRGGKVIYMMNSQDVDVTVTIEGSDNGTDWYTIRSGISLPAGSSKYGILNDRHAYVRAKAVASAAPTSGSVKITVAMMSW